VHLGAPGRSDDESGIAEDKSGIADDKSGIADDMLVSTWGRHRQPWEHIGLLSSCLGKTTSSLGTLLLRLDIRATTYRSTIFKTHVFSFDSHLSL